MTFKEWLRGMRDLVRGVDRAIEAEEEGDNVNATTNFKFGEYGSVPFDKRDEVRDNAKQLEVLRAALGNRSVTIISGYRSPEHNARVGGAKASQHLTGRAADIVVAGVPIREVYLKTLALIAAGRMKQGGVGYYAPRAGGRGNFMHYDTRGRKARWWMDEAGKVHRGVPSWALSVDKGDGLEFTELLEDGLIGAPGGDEAAVVTVAADLLLPI